jgi:putative endonuclease
MEKSYCYILQTIENTLYCGWTLDLERRLKEHNSPDSKTKHTRNRQPCKLVYFEEFDTRAKAAQREIQIKQLLRKQKIELIQTKHPEFTISDFVKRFIINL